MFLGRLHPLVVHLPIGFLILGTLFFYLGRKEKYGFLNQALPITLLLSAVSAVLAVLFGILLAESGGYDESTLAWHRWLGIGVAVVSIVAWLGSKGMVSGKKPWLSWSMGILLLLLLVTGHLGGTLTHGKGYLLDPAPVFVQQLFGEKESESSLTLEVPREPDSVRIYAHLIQPVMEQKCVSCHNENKKKGDLLLDTKEGLLAGGDHGKVLVSGAPMESELLKRVTMNPSSKKFMPPKGVPMFYPEIKLLDFWISSGMSFDLAITDESIPEDIKIIIERHFGLSSQRVAYEEIQAIDPAPNAKIAALQGMGFAVEPLAQGINFLDVKVQGEITGAKMEALLAIKEQVAWLNLSKSNFPDELMKHLAEFPNLTRLRLEKNPITDAQLVHLNKLEHLETLNLYSTKVGDNGLQALADIPSLRKLFLWQTEVTEEGVASLRIKRPGLIVDIGIEDVLTEVVEDT